MDHIRKGHFFDSRLGQQSSRFSQALSTPGGVKSLIQEAVAKGKHTINNRGQTSVLHMFDDVIGTDINGRKTKTLQIFIDDMGNVVNAFPVN